MSHFVYDDGSLASTPVIYHLFHPSYLITLLPMKKDLDLERDISGRDLDDDDDP